MNWLQITIYLGNMLLGFWLIFSAITNLDWERFALGILLIDVTVIRVKLAL